MLVVEVLGRRGYTWSVVVRPVGCTDKFSEGPLGKSYGGGMNIHVTCNPCSQHANYPLPQNIQEVVLLCTQEVFDLSVQLMKNGSKNKRAACIFLFILYHLNAFFFLADEFPP